MQRFKKEVTFLKTWRLTLRTGSFVLGQSTKQKSVVRVLEINKLLLSI